MSATSGLPPSATPPGGVVFPFGQDPFVIFRRMEAMFQARQGAMVSRATRRVTGAANTLAVAILKGDAGKRIVVQTAIVAVRGAAVGAADIVIPVQEQDVQDETATPPAEGAAGTNTLGLSVLPTAAARGTVLQVIQNPQGIEARPGSSVALVVPALGAGAIAELLIAGWYAPERMIDV